MNGNWPKVLGALVALVTLLGSAYTVGYSWRGDDNLRVQQEAMARNLEGITEAVDDLSQIHQRDILSLSNTVSLLASRTDAHVNRGAHSSAEKSVRTLEKEAAVRQHQVNAVTEGIKEIKKDLKNLAIEVARLRRALDAEPDER